MAFLAPKIGLKRVFLDLFKLRRPQLGCRSLSPKTYLILDGFWTFGQKPPTGGQYSSRGPASVDPSRWFLVFRLRAFYARPINYYYANFLISFFSFYIFTSENEEEGERRKNGEKWREMGEEGEKRRMVKKGGICVKNKKKIGEIKKSESWAQNRVLKGTICNFDVEKSGKTRSKITD